MLEKTPLLAFVGIAGIGCILYMETLLLHTVEPNRNVLFQKHLLFMTFFGLMWSFLT